MLPKSLDGKSQKPCRNESVYGITIHMPWSGSRFKNEATSDLFNGASSKKARNALPQDFHRNAQRKLALVVAATSIDDLRIPPGNKLEALSNDREGQHAVRINSQYRICFVMTDDDGATNIEVVDYH